MISLLAQVRIHSHTRGVVTIAAMHIMVRRFGIPLNFDLPFLRPSIVDMLTSGSLITETAYPQPERCMNNGSNVELARGKVAESKAQARGCEGVSCLAMRLRSRGSPDNTYGHDERRHKEQYYENLKELIINPLFMDCCVRHLYA
jgi:hypothetical protein